MVNLRHGCLVCCLTSPGERGPISSFIVCLLQYILSCSPKACILASTEMASLFRVLPHYHSILLTSNP